jgi:hypothetical protein
VRNHFANAYALEHMSERARYRSCTDDQIQLADDAKPVCAAALTAAPGENIPEANTGADFLRCSLVLIRLPKTQSPSTNDGRWFYGNKPPLPSSLPRQFRGDFFP